MNSPPKISVVIPTCDRPDLLKECLKSVYSQTVKPTEVVIVDNGIKSVSIDGLSNDIRLIRLPPKVGASKARNSGVESAKGDYVAFLDDDDKWDINYLNEIKKKILSSEQKPDLIIARKDIVVDGVQKKYKCIENVDNIYPVILHSNVGIGGQNIVVKRESFIAIGGFDPDLVTSEDRALFIEFMLAGKEILVAPDAVVIIDRSPGERLTNAKNMVIGRTVFYRRYNHLMSLKIRILNKYKIYKYKIYSYIHEFKINR